MSIPKIIHYCWFGRKPKPPLAEKCIKSWKKYCPDYQIIEWNEDNFDVTQAPLYVRQAYEVGRWAFVTDYVRLIGLTQMGGIYMDTDVEVVKSLDPYLNHHGFVGFESADRIQTGLMACEPGFHLFQRFLEYYDTATFLLPDGSHDITTNVEVLTRICREEGLAFVDTLQTVAGLTVYPQEFFCPVDYETEKLRRTRKTVTIHWFASSWHTEEELQQLRAEKQRQKEEKMSNLRVRIGTAILGENGYERLKSLIKK